MTQLTYMLLAGAIFLIFSAFSLWYLRREYRLCGKLGWFGSFIHVIMYGVHGMTMCVIAWGADSVPPLGSLAWIGIPLMVLGLGITFYAMDLFRTFSRWLGNKTPGLATNGLYRYSRNPQFVGYGIFILGFALAWWTPLNVIGLLTYVALAYAVTLVEEEHLTRTYGASYQEYCQHVPRYLGFPKD